MSELFRSEATGPTVHGCVWAAAGLVAAQRPALADEIVAGAGDNTRLYAEIEACYRRQPDLRRPPVDHVELARRYLAERDAGGWSAQQTPELAGRASTMPRPPRRPGPIRPHPTPDPTAVLEG